MLVIVTPCVEDEPVFTFPNATLLVLNVRISVAATPVPLKPIVVGEVGALLTIEMLPVAEPAAAGWKTALNVLVSPGLMESGTVKPEVLKPVPLTVAWVIVSTPFPVFFT